MGCLGARGESGKPTNPVLGESGRDGPAPSRGNLGVGGFIGRWLGRGLRGSPGLMGFVERIRSVALNSFRLSFGLSILAKEIGADKNVEAPGVVGSGDNALMDEGIGMFCG